MFPTLTDEQRRFVSTVRELAQSEFRERAPRWMDGTFPWDNMKPLAEMGVSFGSTATCCAKLSPHHSAHLGLIERQFSITFSNVGASASSLRTGSAHR